MDFESLYMALESLLWILLENEIYLRLKNQNLLEKQKIRFKELASKK